jgi:transcriptional regulator GlxA family with amidase domain
MDMLLICAGGNPSTFRDVKTLNWLRKISRQALAMGGVSGGPFILARAGLLDGYRCTIHWEHFPAFVEEFPQAAAERSLFVIDRARLTCAGGISALDMMHAVIEQEHGHDLAAAVSEWFLQTQIRSGSGPQKMSARERFNVSNAALLRVLEYMEARVETPANRRQLASVSGLSIRQLERLFARHLGSTLGEHYLRIRLERARILLRQTSQSVLAVAVATGFVTASHFSRAYRKCYGLAPSRDRTTEQSEPREIHKRSSNRPASVAR